MASTKDDAPHRRRKVEDIPDPAMNVALKYIDFLNKSPSKYQAVQNCCDELLKAGFVELSIQDTWNLSNRGKYFTVKNDSCLISFIIGSQYKQGSPFAIVVTHTDSPALKIKHNSNGERSSYALVNSGLYGGGNWLTWFDRDMKIAGKAYLRQNNKIISKLVHIDESVCYVPNLAIHFTSYPPNLPDLEANMVPIIGLTNDSNTGRHRDELMELLATHLSCSTEDIVEFDLDLVDDNPAKLVGNKKEFISGQHQDNLISTFSSIEAITRASNNAFLLNGNHVAVAVNFDHEEVGNTSDAGAATDFTLEVLQRICGGYENYSQAAQNSFIVSCDAVHALHPNYENQYEMRNRVDIFGGMAIKFSPKLNYSTNGYTSTVAKQIALLGDVPIQDFAVRNDARSGSTLGPTVSAKLGIDSVDVGTGMLAMHSIRELSGTIGVAQCVNFIESLFVNYGILQAIVKKN